MPCDYSKYPANWKTHIVPAIRERSGDNCEWCGIVNHSMRHRYDELGTSIKVVLTVAHLDHDIDHNDGMDSGRAALPVEEANLVHLCQRCHNRHDGPHRRANASLTRDRKRGQLRFDTEEVKT